MNFQGAGVAAQSKVLPATQGRGVQIPMWKTEHSNRHWWSTGGEVETGESLKLVRQPGELSEQTPDPPRDTVSKSKVESD